MMWTINITKDEGVADPPQGLPRRGFAPSASLVSKSKASIQKIRVHTTSEESIGACRRTRISLEGADQQ